MEQKRDRTVAEMQAERKKRILARITQHTTSEADRVVREVPQAVHEIITEELDKRFGPAPQGAMEEALVQRVAANKRIRELRKQEKKDAASLAGAAAEPADEKPAVLSDFFAGAAAAEPTDSSQLPDSVLGLPGNTEAEERPAKRRADAFAPLRAVLAK